MTSTGAGLCPSTYRQNIQKLSLNSVPFWGPKFHSRYVHWILQFEIFTWIIVSLALQINCCCRTFPSNIWTRTENSSLSYCGRTVLSKADMDLSFNYEPKHCQTLIIPIVILLLMLETTIRDSNYANKYPVQWWSCLIHQKRTSHVCLENISTTTTDLKLISKTSLQTQDSQRLLELFSWKHPWTPRAKWCGGAKFSWEQQGWKYDEFLAGIPGPNCCIPEHWRYLEHILPLLNLLLRWLVLEFPGFEGHVQKQPSVYQWRDDQLLICSPGDHP